MRNARWITVGALLGIGAYVLYGRLVSGAQPRDNDANETTRVRRIYDDTARQYDDGMRLSEWLLLDGGRERVCSRAHGDVLEVAVGTGRNLAYYAKDVRLTGVDLSPEMLGIARLRSNELGLRAQLQVGDAQHLEFPDSSFDTVVCTLSLCTIPDDRQAVAEIRRVLKPGGRYLALEHVRSPLWPVRLAQRALDPLSVRFTADHLLREPYDIIRDLDFEIEQFERSKLGLIEHVVARKPE